MPSCPECGTEFEAGEMYCPQCSHDVSNRIAMDTTEEVPEFEDPGDLDSNRNNGTESPASNIQSDDAPESPPEEEDHAPYLNGVKPIGPSAPSDEDADSSDFTPDNLPSVESKSPPLPPQPPVEAGICSRCGCESTSPVCDTCTKSPPPTLILELENKWDTVLFRGKKVKRVLVTMDLIRIGRRDPVNRVWPEVDLFSFHNDKRGFISREHAEIVRREGDKHFLMDVAGNNSTWYFEAGSKKHIELNKDEMVELKEGDRVIIGEEVGFSVIVPKD